jgi:hypothetical protein
MADLTSFEVEQLRRSVAMLPPEAPAGLGREKALAILDQLRRVLETEEHRLAAGNHPSALRQTGAGSIRPAPGHR